MDCESVKRMVKDKDVITEGMNKEQLHAFTELLDHVCEGHDMDCECGEYFDPEID